MRNRTVKIAKYAYLDTDINRAPAQLTAALPSKKQRTGKIAILLHLLFVMVVALMIYSIQKFYHTDVENLLEKINKNIVISEVRIDGNTGVTTEEIVNAIDLVLPIEIAVLDLENIRTEILKNSLIKDAEVKIELPNKISIQITERSAVALWFDHGVFHLIDRDGFVVKSNVALQDNPLIIAAGEGSNNALDELLNELKDHSILEQIFAAQLVSNRRWNILLKNGLIVKLPATGINEALGALDVLLKNYRPTKPFEKIDLRLAPDRIYTQ